MQNIRELAYISEYSGLTNYATKMFSAMPAPAILTYVAGRILDCQSVRILWGFTRESV